MIEHPILATASEKDKTSNIWLANLFVLWGSSQVLLRQKITAQKSLESNPISYESFERRYNEITKDFTDRPTADDFITEVKLEFDKYYYTPQEPEPFYAYQEKSIPYFDLRLAQKLSRIIFLSESRHKDFYAKYSSEPTADAPAFPNTRTGQWLLKFLRRRYAKGVNTPQHKEFVTDYKNFVAETYWDLVPKLLASDIADINHFLQMLARPDMAHARHIDFNKGTIASLIVKLTKVTGEISARSMKKEKAQLIEQQSPSEVFIELPDGWKWVKIKDSFNSRRDDVEAKLMGHCATPEWENSYLISLRDKNHEPWVTATIKELAEGMYVLGQVKGRGNKKPPGTLNEKLYALFSMPEIIMQNSEDRNDWNFRDFSTLQQAIIKTEKPYFNDPKKLPEYFPVKKLIAAVKSKLKGEGSITVEKNGDIYWHDETVKTFVNYYFSKYNSRTQKKEKPWWLNYLENGHVEISYDISKDDAASWFIDNILDSKQGKLIYKALDKELQKEGHEFESDDKRKNLVWAFHYGDTLASELASAIAQSMEDSYQSSVFSQLEEYFKGYFEKIRDELPGAMSLHFYDGVNKKEVPLETVYYESGFNVYIKANVVDLLSEYSFEDIDPNLFEEKMDETISNTKRAYWDNISLDDYSDEYALESFNERFLHDLIDQAKAILKPKKAAVK